MDILEFRGETKWLSNFHLEPVIYEGVTYPAIENAYQAAKTAPEFRAQFTICSPAESKKLGYKVELRADWEKVKVDVMRTLIEHKFRKGSALGDRLVATHPGLLVEGNTWNDTFWGVCNGIGKNMLGELLMAQRKKLIES